MLTRRHLIQYALLIAAVVIFAGGLLYKWQSISPGNDFYSPYVGAQRVLAGLSPYGAQASAALAAVWHDPFAEAGIAYPLPFLLLVIPFALLSFPVAALLWTALGVALGYASAFVARAEHARQNYPAGYAPLTFILPLAFWPFFRAARLGQASLIWFALAALLILAIQGRRGWFVAVLVALLPLKPQAGILFALYGAWWLYRHHRRGLLLTSAIGLTLLGASHALQPGWIAAWLAQVAAYNLYVEPPLLLPFVAALWLSFWRVQKPWWVTVAMLQAIIFPMSDLYSTLPLLFVWCLFPAPLALVGVSMSWLALLLPASNSGLAVLLCMVVPPMLAALWVGRPRTNDSQPRSSMASDPSPTGQA
jgi:hypothetical protein